MVGWLDDRFVQYIEDRRREPRGDVLTSLAADAYPDGTRPTSSTSCALPRSCSPPGRRPPCALARRRVKHLALHPDVQGSAAGEPRPHSQLPRGDAPPREPGEGRLPPRPPRHERRRRRRRRGTPVMLSNGAANRDPRPFECPVEFRTHRPNAEGPSPSDAATTRAPAHPSPDPKGAWSLERILDRMTDIRLSEEHDGPPGGALPFRVRTDVGPAGPHRTPTPGVHTCGGGQVSRGRGRHRRRGRASASAPRNSSRPTATGSRSLDLNGAAAEEQAAGASGRYRRCRRRRRPRGRLTPRSRGFAASSGRSGSSSRAWASNCSRRWSTSPPSAGTASSR